MKGLDHPNIGRHFDGRSSDLLTLFAVRSSETLRSHRN